MKITETQLRRIIKQEKTRLLEQDEETQHSQDHHWPRVEWDTKVGELADKWHDAEMKSFDPKDPSMMQDGELSATEAKDYWREQVDQASYDLENELTIEIRKVALAAMKAITDRLINGDYA